MNIRNDIAFNQRTGIVKSLETIWVDMYLPKTKPIIIGICYHPPRKIYFFSVLEDLYLTCNRFTNSECIIMVISVLIIRILIVTVSCMSVSDTT